MTPPPNIIELVRELQMQMQIEPDADIFVISRKDGEAILTTLLALDSNMRSMEETNKVLVERLEIAVECLEKESEYCLPYNCGDEDREARRVRITNTLARIAPPSSL